MGRTGSSAITRSLRICGVDLGGQLHSLPTQINPTGLWEDTEIERLNDEILYCLKTRHGSLSVITKERIKREIPERLRKLAVNVLEKSFLTAFHSDSRISE